MRRATSIAFERGGVLALAILVVYAWLAPAHIVDGDNAELATLGNLGGAAHPPGYPLYVLILRALAWLPGSPAHAAALATALLGAAHALVLHAACRAWGARPFAATLAVALYATSPLALREYTQADVFALNGLAVGAVLWLAAEAGPLRGSWRALALGLVAGLGLANNTSCVLVAPIGLYGVWLAVREARLHRTRSAAVRVRVRVRVLALALGGLAVGLAPYLTLFGARDGAGTWGVVRDLGDLLAMFTRRDYGATSLSARGADVSFATRELALIASLGRAWLWLPLVAGLAVLALRIARPAHATRTAWSVLAATMVLVGPAFATRLNLAPEGFGQWLVPRFHLMAICVMAVPIASAFEELLARVPAPKPIVQAAVVALAVVAPTAVALPWLARVHGPAVEQGVTNLLRSLPRDAVVIVVPDDLNFGTTYAQQVLGERRDVVVVTWQMIQHAWYRARIEARGVVLGGEPVSSVAVAERVLAKGRPLFVDEYAGNILKAFPSVPYGTVFRVLPRGAPLPPIGEVVAQNRTLFAAFVLGEPPDSGDDLAAIVYQRYAQTWRILAEGLAAAGQRAEAVDAATLAEALAPR